MVALFSKAGAKVRGLF